MQNTSCINKLNKKQKQQKRIFPKNIVFSNFVSEVNLMRLHYDFKSSLNSGGALYFGAYLLKKGDSWRKMCEPHLCLRTKDRVMDYCSERWSELYGPTEGLQTSVDKLSLLIKSPYSLILIVHNKMKQISSFQGQSKLYFDQTEGKTSQVIH